MAAGLIASLMNAVNATMAAQAAKSTMDMNKKKDKSDILDDGLLSGKSKSKGTSGTPRNLSKSERDDLMVMLGEGGLSSKKIKEIMKTGYISEEDIKSLPAEVIKNIEGLTGVSMAFPTGDKPEGTPPVVGKAKKTTRTETPDGEVRETTTTFDSTSGGKKSSRTEIPDDDLSDLLSNVDLAAIPPEKITPNHPLVRKAANEHGVAPEIIAKELRKNLRTQESLRGGIVESKREAAKNFDQANKIHGRTVEVDNSDVMPSHMSKAEQNLVRHAGQERLARQILRNEEKAKEGLLHKDE